MIKVNVRDISNRNVEQLDIEISGYQVECGELVKMCKDMLNITDDRNYSMKQNQVFIHPTEKISDGEHLIFSVMPDDSLQEE